MAKSKRTDEEDNCSFCGRLASQVERLIAGPPGVNICNECVDVCGTLLKQQDGKPAEVTFDRNEPEYAWATGFPEMPGLKAEPAASTETPNAPQNRGIHPLVLVIGIAAFAGTWLLLRKVKRISRGAFNIGPRE